MLKPGGTQSNVKALKGADFFYGCAGLSANRHQCAVHSSAVLSLSRPASVSCRVSRCLLPAARNYFLSSSWCELGGEWIIVFMADSFKQFFFS